MRPVGIDGGAISTALGAFFPETGDVLANHPSEDTRGYEVPDWLPVSGLTGLPCAVGSDSVSVNQLQSGGMLTRTITSLKFLIAGYHADVTTANRWRWRESDWRIVGVFPDAAAAVTHLSCELVVPGV